MQALCIRTAGEHCDVQCPCCGQQYSVYYSRLGKTECAECLELVRDALVEHHRRSSLAAAHPSEPFNVPAWNGPAHASAAALLSGAPITAPIKRQAATLAPASPTATTLAFAPTAQQRRVS